MSLNRLVDNSDTVRWALLIGLAVVFTFLLYPKLVIKKHTYKLGDVATRDIKAAKDFLIEDEDATEASRKQAVANVLTVYDHDVTLSARINRNVKKSL